MRSSISASPSSIGAGIARQAHDALIGVMRSRGVTRAWLRVFTGNGRGRAFDERLGWRPTGERTRSTFAPNPELLHYERDLEGWGANSAP